MSAWTLEQVEWLKNNYPHKGKVFCAKYLGKSDASVRMKTFRLGLFHSTESAFFKEFQARAALSKVGKKRPDQALVIKNLHAQGKLKKTENQKKLLGIRMQERIKEMGHPKGFLGGKHNAAAKNKISASSKAYWANPNSYCHTVEYRQRMSDRMSEMQRMNKNMRKGYSRGKQGQRSDLNNLYVRSSWEANYARYLNWLVAKKQIYKWEYEPDVFIFEAIKRGTRSYTPDFKIWEKQDSIPYYIEVKGWLDAKGATKLKRMEKYYPDVRVVLIDAKAYRNLEKQLKSLIPLWE